MHDNYNPDDIGAPEFYSPMGADTSKEYRVMRVGEFVKMQDGYIAVPVENLEPILNDNFETALKALIDHHGADALTSLAAVMWHYDLTFLVDGLIIDQSNKLIFESTYEVITELDIKPEK